jgi:hypothetical protein
MSISEKTVAGRAAEDSKSAAVLEEKARAANAADDPEVAEALRHLVEQLETHSSNVQVAVSGGKVVGPVGAGNVFMHDIINQNNYHNYMIYRGPDAHRAFVSRPREPWDSSIKATEKIEDLRTKLLHGHRQPREPIQITVRGTLFPCALLRSGWWDLRNNKEDAPQIKWKGGEIQQWLFHGFELWGPSWDFSWDLDNWEDAQKRPFFIAQLGDGDEANSLPVLIPREKARKLRERLKSWGGVEANVSGILGHRQDFSKAFDPNLLTLFGGLLDYCLWLDQERSDHGIDALIDSTAIYSGYLWKCVSPKQWLRNGRIPRLDDVFFVWEHANWASQDAVAFSLEALEKKEEYIRKRFGDLTLVQKSSWLVPGAPEWEQRQIYDVLLRKAGKTI